MILYYSTVIIDGIKHVPFVFSLCQVEGTHREHVQIVEVAHVHVDGTYDHVKQVNNIQFEVESRQVADFDRLYFVGQVCHGELNGSVLVNLHQVVCRLNRCISRSLQKTATKLP